jgi:hypothetical protein
VVTTGGVDEEAAATVVYAWFKANPQAAKLTGGCNSESRLVHTRSSALPAEMQAATDGAATCNGLASQATRVTSEDNGKNL